ncbi:MAG: hypothetical protein R3A11_04700 [Bdellovibrionota bacterium]
MTQRKYAILLGWMLLLMVPSSSLVAQDDPYHYNLSRFSSLGSLIRSGAAGTVFEISGKLTADEDTIQPRIQIASSEFSFDDATRVRLNNLLNTHFMTYASTRPFEFKTYDRLQTPAKDESSENGPFGHFWNVLVDTISIEFGITPDQIKLQANFDFHYM